MDINSFVRGAGVASLVLFFAPAVAWACPICFGLETGSDEARSLNWAVFTLLGVTGGVLSGFVGFIFHLVKRSRQALGAETNASGSDVRSGGRS